MNGAGRPSYTDLSGFAAMWKHFKQFFERLAYAGLKPQGGRPAQQASQPEAPKRKGFAALHAWLDSKLNQAGPADPLYLSNRSTAQKAKVWALIAVPPVVILGVVAAVLLSSSNAPPAPPPAGLSNAEIASKMLPELNTDLHIQSQHDLDIEDVHVETGEPVRLAGIAKNNSDRAIAKAELIFDLTDRSGSRQGAVTTEVRNIGPKAAVPFEFPIEQSKATFALVREVHVE